jgi:ATP adenylyltransferase
MDYLWTPWRYQYIVNTGQAKGCIFCDALAAGDDATALILFRGKKNFLILNRFPYTTGHVMVVPHAHQPDLASTDAATLQEMMELSRRAQIALAEVYRPEGFNLGINLGKCAGAGVADHLHMHILPRWTGDTNFMTVVGETRVQPEDLQTTYARLKPFFSASRKQRSAKSKRKPSRRQRA